MQQQDLAAVVEAQGLVISILAAAVISHGILTEPQLIKLIGSLPPFDRVAGDTESPARLDEPQLLFNCDVGNESVDGSLHLAGASGPELPAKPSEATMPAWQ